MQRQPAVTTPDATLRSAARRMAADRVALLPVISDGRLVGTLSALDLMAGTAGDESDSDLDLDARSVRTVMRKDPPSCRPEDSLEQVHRLMCDHRVPALPVIDANAELVGLADLFDIEAALDAHAAAGPEPPMVKRVRGEPG
jgi:CBS domain-containing protein